MTKRNLRNKIFSACILLWVFGCAFAYAQINTVNAEEDLHIEGNYAYKVCENPKSGKHAEIHEYLGNETHVVVPDTLGGYPVYGARLFTMQMEDTERLNQIQSVEFPKTLINLHGMSCMWFENLSSVTIHEGTEFIGTAAFSRCFSLRSITIPASVTNIAEDISDVKEMEYRVQEGSYADKYLTEAGEQNITRTGTKVRATNLLIDGKKETAKDVEVSSPSDSRSFCIEADLIPSNASNRRITWTVDNEEVIDFKDNEGLNNYGSRMCFSIKKGGQARITAVTDDGGYVAECVLNAKMNIACHAISLSEESYEYDGTEKKPKVIIDNLTEGEDFSVEYNDNIEPGTGTVIIRGLGLNTGTVSKSFTISLKEEEKKPDKGDEEKEPDKNPDKDSPVTENRPAVVPDKGNFSQDKVTIKKPSGFKVKNVKKRKVKVRWKKVKGADGYEIYRSTKKNGEYSRIKTIKKVGTVNYTNSKLKNKKQYYYKIRAYKTVNGKKYYSVFSGVKSVKIKK